MRSEVNPSALTLGTRTFVCKTKSFYLRDRDVPRDNTFPFLRVIVIMGVDS